MPNPNKVEYSDDGSAFSVVDRHNEASQENPIVVPLTRPATQAPKRCPGDIAGAHRVWGVWRRADDPRDSSYLDVQSYGVWTGTAEDAARFSGNMNSGPADPNWNVHKLGPRYVMRPYHGAGCECWGIWVMPLNGEHPHWAAGSHGRYFTMWSLAAAMRGEHGKPATLHVRHRDPKIEAAYHDCGSITDGNPLVVPLTRPVMAAQAHKDRGVPGKGVVLPDPLAACPGASAGHYGVWRRWSHDPQEGCYLVDDNNVTWIFGTEEEARAFASVVNSGPADPNWDVALLGPKYAVRPVHGIGCECWGIWIMPHDGEAPHWITGPHGKPCRGHYLTMLSAAKDMRSTSHGILTVRHRDPETEAAIDKLDMAIENTLYRQITGRAQRPLLPPHTVAAPCRICEASPCDCDEPVWTYAFRRPGTKAHLNVSFRDGDKLATEFTGFTRREAYRLLAKAPADYAYGPLQRLTDPVHIFGTEQPTDRCDIGDCWVHVECKLPWCGRPAKPDAYCSDRCREYDEKRLSVEERLIDFTVFTQEKVTKALAIKPDDAVALTSEVLWAEKKCDEELAVIERQFRSLRVEE